MPDGDENAVRTVRLPVSGDVVQWLPDGRWRLVTQAQFQTEQSRSPRLPVEWFDPADGSGSYSSERHSASGDRPAWWRAHGMVSKETDVVARYPDGTDAVVFIAGPFWVVEGLLADGMASVAVGEPISDAITRDRARAARFRPAEPDVQPDAESEACWGSTRRQRSEPGDHTAPRSAASDGDPTTNERRRQGVAYLVWTGNSRARAGSHDESLDDGYSCSLQPFGGQRLPVEDGPELPTLDDALAWARARTSTIIVRPQWDPGVNYWATDDPPTTWKRVRYRNAR